MSSITFKVSQANRRMRERAGDRTQYENGTGPYVVKLRKGPSPQALAEVARAYAAPLEIRHVVLGDPLPGRSALDHKRGPGHG